jgi:dTDP-4-amino-4,6-dideoxygalactose transaminase
LNAAYLWAQLEAAEKIQTARMNIWNKYNSAFKSLEKAGKVTLPVIPESCVHNAHIFYMITKSLEERTALISFLKEKDICAVFHYIPLHSAPAGLKFGRFDSKDEITTEYSERLIRLPLYYGLTDSEQQKVIDAVLEFYK